MVRRTIRATQVGNLVGAGPVHAAKNVNGPVTNALIRTVEPRIGRIKHQPL
jgi:hypothetical protein